MEISIDLIVSRCIYHHIAKKKVNKKILLHRNSIPVIENEFVNSEQNYMFEYNWMHKKLKKKKKPQLIKIKRII